MLQIVNMIPKSLSGETDQDSEPNLAVNPEQPKDAGVTWSLRPIVPGGPGTADITVGFGSRGGALYAGILNFTTFKFNVLRTANPFALTPMKLLVDRPNEDQPWVSAITAHVGRTTTTRSTSATTTSAPSRRPPPSSSRATPAAAHRPPGSKPTRSRAGPRSARTARRCGPQRTSTTARSTWPSSAG